MMSEVVPPSSAAAAAASDSDPDPDGHKLKLNDMDSGKPNSNNDSQSPPPPPPSTHPHSTESNPRDFEYPEETQTQTQRLMHGADANTGMGVTGEGEGAGAGEGAGKEFEGEGEGEGENDMELGSTTMAERTLVGEPGEEGNKHGHGRGMSSSSLSLPTKDNAESAYRKSLDRSSHRNSNSVDLHGHGQGYARVPNTANSLTTPSTWDPLKGHPDADAEEEEKPDWEDKTQVPYVQDKDKTIIVEEGDDVVDSTGKLLYPPEPSDEHHDMDTENDPDREPKRKSVPLASRRASHLRLDLKPPSPMPWEHIPPPLDNNLKAIAGYYSPVTSHKFRTLQNSGGPRPLIPKSSYYFGPPPPESAYGTPPTGQIGVHHPREVLRVERDYTGGELIQFAPIYPLELEGRITPTHFLESINAINELLISAHSLRHSLVDNALAIFSLQVSKLFVKTHFEKEMQRLRRLVDELNTELYNPVGLNILWPRNVAFLYLEIEYY